MLSLILGFPVSKRAGHTGASLLMNHKDYQGLGESAIQEEAERPGTVRPGVEKAQRDLSV